MADAKNMWGGELHVTTDTQRFKFTLNRELAHKITCSNNLLASQAQLD